MTVTHARQVIAPRGRARGEIHAGLLAAGLLVALGLAWWLARPGTPGDRTSMTDPAPASNQAVVAPSTAARGRESAVDTDSASKPLYRWTDAAGVVHFTDVPPGDRPYVEVDVNPDRNVMQSPATPEP